MGVPLNQAHAGPWAPGARGGRPAHADHRRIRRMPPTTTITPLGHRPALHELAGPPTPPRLPLLPARSARALTCGRRRRSLSLFPKVQPRVARGLDWGRSRQPPRGLSAVEGAPWWDQAQGSPLRPGPGGPEKYPPSAPNSHLIPRGLPGSAGNCAPCRPVGASGTCKLVLNATTPKKCYSYVC